MISHGLNDQGIDVGSSLNPGPLSPFDPATPPKRTFALPAGVIQAEAQAAAMAKLTAASAGVVKASSEQASVTQGSATPSGIVQTHGKQADS